MIHWIKHSYSEDTSGPEDGPGMVEVADRVAVEVVNGKASLVQVVGSQRALISGEGEIDLEEVEKAGKWLRAFECVTSQLDGLQDPRMYSEEELDVVQVLMAAEERLLREACERAVNAGKLPEITTGCGFACLDTYFFGTKATAVWDLEKGGEFIGVLKKKTGVAADHEDDKTPHYRWAVLDLMQMANDCDFEYFFDDELEACKSMRASMATHRLDELSNAVSGSSLMIER